jgi:hypothetical protein
MPRPCRAAERGTRVMTRLATARGSVVCGEAVHPYEDGRAPDGSPRWFRHALGCEVHHI